jgi:hypothetical protein
VEAESKIIKLTPHDGPRRGERMTALKKYRADYLNLKKERRQLVRNLVAGMLA